jgi:hypothetical protein
MSSPLREWARKIIALASRITSTQAMGWREFMWLCLPALLVGLFLRTHFLWVTPQGFFGADSSSYFDFSHDLFIDGDLEISPKRRWFYPIVLALLTPLPLLSSWHVVPLVQHGLGLVTVVGIGWITLRLSTWPRLTIPLVTLICAMWPRMLWYEHEFIAESFVLAAFVLTISLALVPGVFRSKRGLLLIFLSMILLAGFKAAGRFLWLGAIIGIVIYAGDPRRWAWSIKSALAAIASVVVAATMGQSSQGYWLLLNSVLPLVEESGEPHGRYRKALQPLIMEARSTGDNYPWNKYKYKKVLRNRDPTVKPHPDWASLVKNERQFTEVARSLSSQAIREHPMKFLKFTVSSIAISSERGGVLPRFEPFVFWRDQLRAAGKNKDEPTYAALAFRVDQRELERLASQGRRKTYGLMGFHLWIDEMFRPLAQPSGQQGLATLIIRPFGVLVGLGLLLCLRPGFIRRAALLLVPSGVYALAVFAVGDAVPRYLHPIEWVGFILGILALEILLRLAFKLFRNLRTFVLSHPRQQTL